MEVPEIVFSSEMKKPLQSGTLEYLSANDFSLTIKEKNRACVELSETEEKKIRKIKELRIKLENNVDGVNYRTDEAYLLRFLRVRKYDVSKCYKIMKEGYVFKKKHPDILHIPSNLESLLKLNMYVYLPYIDESGQVIFFMDIENWKHRETSFLQVLQVMSAVCDIISMNPRNQVNGLIGIWDMKKLNRHHISSIVSDCGLGAFSFFMQKVFPWRVKRLLLINSHLLSQLLFKMTRPFISKKISERVVILGSDMEKLHQYVNPVLLPRKLGGVLEENQYSVTQNILDNMCYIKYERSFSLTGNCAGMP